jgi:two-component system LytT family response regulator
MDHPITLYDKNGKFTVAITDVTHLKGEGNYTTVHLATGRRILSARSLCLFAEIPGLVRIHKGYLVNVAYIRRLKVHNAKEAFVILKSGATLAVSRRRIAYVEQRVVGLRAT